MMSRSVLRQHAMGLAAILFLALTGCGGGGGSDDAAPSSTAVTVSGVVTAPAGQVAQLQNKSVFYALLEQLLPSADAAINGVSTVADATVTAVRVDGSGNVVATLGSTTTDAQGHYRLTLPSGTALAPTILLRVQGGGVELRAPAVQVLVDISPASEWLLQELNTEGVLLDSLSNDDLLFLQAVLESYTVDAGGDIAATLTNLAPLRAMMMAEIAAVQASSSTPVSFNGTWVMSGNDIMVGNVLGGDVNGVWISGQWINTLSDYTVTLAQQSGNTYGVTLTGYESETSSYAHGSNCAISVTPPYVSGCTFQSYNWAGDGFYEEKSFGPVTTTQEIFALDDGRVVLPYAAQETIEDGDMFAYITPPYVEVLMPMGGDGVTPDAYAGIATWPTFAYALTSDDTAADRTQLRGGSGDVKPMALIKQGSGLLPGTMNGTYAYIAFNHDIAIDGDRTHNVLTGTLSSAGDGNLGTGTITGAELARVANNSSTQTLTGTALGANITGGTYSLNGDGSLALSIATDAADQPPTLTGRMNGSGNFFYARAVEAGLQQVVHTSVFGIKVGTDAPSLAGRTYRFRATDLEYGAGGYSRYGHLAYSTLEFVDGSNVTVTVNSQEIDRDNDITSITSHAAVMNEVISGGTYTTGANGAFTISLTDGTLIRGYVNARSMLAVQLRGFPASGALDLTGSDAGLGIAMGRCASGC